MKRFILPVLAAIILMGAGCAQDPDANTVAPTLTDTTPIIDIELNPEVDQEVTPENDHEVTGVAPMTTSVEIIGTDEGGGTLEVEVVE